MLERISSGGHKRVNVNVNVNIILSTPLRAFQG